jgi:hypothetical protein
VSRYVASFAARSAAALPREGVSRCPVCDLTCLRIVCREADCGACADLVLIAVTIALIYGRAAHRRVERLVQLFFYCLDCAFGVCVDCDGYCDGEGAEGALNCRCFSNEIIGCWEAPFNGGGVEFIFVKVICYVD